MAEGPWCQYGERARPKDVGIVNGNVGADAVTSGNSRTGIPGITDIVRLEPTDVEVSVSKALEPRAFVRLARCEPVSRVCSPSGTGSGVSRLSEAAEAGSLYNSYIRQQLSRGEPPCWSSGVRSIPRARRLSDVISRMPDVSTRTGRAYPVTVVRLEWP